MVFKNTKCLILELPPEKVVKLINISENIGMTVSELVESIIDTIFEA